MYMYIGVLVQYGILVKWPGPLPFNTTGRVWGWLETMQVAQTGINDHRLNANPRASLSGIVLDLHILFHHAPFATCIVSIFS